MGTKELKSTLSASYLYSITLYLYNNNDSVMINMT